MRGETTSGATGCQPEISQAHRSGRGSRGTTLLEGADAPIFRGSVLARVFAPDAMGSVRWSDENLCGKVHNVREYSLAAGLRVQPVELARHFVEHLVDEV
jgi:hypothetical protein